MTWRLFSICVFLSMFCCAGCRSGNEQMSDERPTQSKVEALSEDAYTPEKVQASLEQHKPVVIDYTAEWCPGCHILDKMVLADPRVAPKLAQVTFLRVDATDMESPRVQDLLDKNEIVGLPTVRFLDAGGKEIKKARIEGAVPVEEFIESLALLAKENNTTFKE